MPPGPFMRGPGLRGCSMEGGRSRKGLMRFKGFGREELKLIDIQMNYIMLYLSIEAITQSYISTLTSKLSIYNNR